MILTCPKCATRYLVAPAALGRDGRRVRCAKCFADWWQDAPPPVPGAPQPVPEPPPPAPEPQVYAQPDSTPAESADADSAPRVRRNLPALPKEKSRLGVGWLLLVVVVLALLIIGFVGRQSLVNLWPPMGTLYETLHIPVERPGAAIELRNLRSTMSEENGQNVLTVSGDLANTTGKMQKVPPIRFSFRDAAGNEMAISEEPAGMDDLPAGGSAGFSIKLPAPPPDARDLEVTVMLPHS